MKIKSLTGCPFIPGVKGALFMPASLHSKTHAIIQIANCAGNNRPTLM